MATTFDLLRADSRSVALLVVILSIVILSVPFVIYLLYAPLSGGKVELVEQGVKIHYPFYGRTVPYDEISADKVSRLDYRQHPEKRAKWRTNGIGLPGYASGWFRLQNGEKALLFVADIKNVVEVPTTSGYVVHMSVANPDEFLTALRAKF